jgi:dipeptidyl aminopeptidase/acylaminoacyl peptidase
MKGQRMFKQALLAFAAGAAMISAHDAAAAPSAQAAPPAKLAAYMDYTFVDELTASESGNRLAWTEIHKGVRNIWTAEAPDFHPHRLTDGRADDGIELAGLNFTPDGKTLAWSTGGGGGNGWANGMPPPNPASAVEQPHKEIWISAAGGAPMRLLQDGEAPLLSSKGRLAYLKEGQAWTADITGKEKPKRLFYDHGRVGQLTWSPDGTRLAFVSRRGDHSFIGVYSGPDHPLVWLAPATANDANPVWSPDGQRIAFSRVTGIAGPLASSLVEAPNPFSIWVGSASDGTASAVWRSPATLDGSFPEVPGGLFLMWGASDRLTFRAEMDGWPHLYSLPAAGGDATLLTPGPFMVDHVAMTPDRGALLFSANSGPMEGDTDRRHIFKVAVDHSGPAPLTPGRGSEWTPAALADGRAAYISSSATTALHITIAGADGRGAHSVAPAEDGYTADGFVTPKPVTFTAADGLLVHGQLFMPPGGGPKHPALVFVHGGPPRQMLLGWSYMDYYTHSYVLNQYLASRGFVVLSVNYRLGIGYGRAFQHPAKAGLAGDSEYQDVLAGAHFLQALPQVDPDRLGIWGGSYGGLLTAQALARNSDIFKAGVDFHGVHDWSLTPGVASRPQRYEQGDYDEMMKTAFESSPEAAIAGWRSPVLLIHGDDDRNVRFDQTTDLARRLAAQGTPFEELILPNEIHEFLRYDSWVKADTATVRFLEDKLKP